jgi:hypothetical protein
MGIICFADADKRRTKKQMQENFHLFFANLCNCCARWCDVTYIGKDGEEKRESCGRYYITEKNV